MELTRLLDVVATFKKKTANEIGEKPNEFQEEDWEERKQHAIKLLATRKHKAPSGVQLLAMVDKFFKLV